jgi:hypothetical protein
MSRPTMWFRFSIDTGERDNDDSIAIFLGGPEEPLPDAMTQNGQANICGDQILETVIDHCQFQCDCLGETAFMLLDEEEGSWTHYYKKNEFWVEGTSHSLGEFSR